MSRRSGSTTPPAPIPIRITSPISAAACRPCASAGSRRAAMSRPMPARDPKPEDDGLKPGEAAASRSSTAPAASRCGRSPAPRRPSSPMPAPASSRRRWNTSPSARTSAGRSCAKPRNAMARTSAPRSRLCHRRIRPRRGRPRPRHHPGEHQPPGIRADGHRPEFPGQDQRQYRQLRRRLLGRQEVDKLVWAIRWGADTVMDLSPAATSTPRANGSSATARCRSARCRSTRRWRR